MDAREHTVASGDVELLVRETGAGHPVLLLHGFPELGWSWRHQVPALAGAGFRVLWPDLRGFGRSSAPPAPDAYDLVTLAGDVLAIADDAGIDRFALVGHDWGAALAWTVAMIHPDRVERVAGLSVPAVPRAPAAPLAILRRRLGEDFYIVWFQAPGVADEALARDVRRTLRTTEVWGREWAGRDEEPARPSFWTAQDEALYVAEYERTGFTGGLNWYRAMDRTWERTAPWADARIEQPALFLTGTRDPVRRFMPAEAMRGIADDLRVVELEGAGHWVQQERPDEVNAALLEFLGS